jgi:hypothetical protein
MTIALTLGFLACTAGCRNGWNWFQRDGRPDKDAAAAERGEQESVSAAYRDTIGQYTWVEGMRRMGVTGYGLVVGLGTRGSEDCPREVRDRLLQELHKRPEFHRAGTSANPLTPEMMIQDPDTAVVAVQGEIPAGAVKGSRFDVRASALPGTQTTSLRGGWLYNCHLSYYRMVTPTAGVSGQALAWAEGPLLLNPFSDRPDAATRSPGRAGHVVGGGIVAADRRLHLVLFRPSYSKAQAIATRINARFSGAHKVADPTSPSYIRLRVPDEYARDPKRFIALVQHLYLPQGAGFGALRARELAEEVVKPDAPYEDIALAWEGIGRTVLPTISKLYSHEVAVVRYCAALAGLRLGDDVAIEVVADQARDARSPYRFDAICALGESRGVPRAARPLRMLLDDSDAAVRVAAYEALLERGDPEIETRRIGRDNFALDSVPSATEHLIYVKRSDDRRIAVFGSGVRCQPPLFWRHPSGEVTVNAFEADTGVTVHCKDRRTGSLAPPRQVSFDVTELVGLLGSRPPRYPDDPNQGFGLDYGTVVQLIYELCDMRAIDARFMLERPSIGEMFGPLRPEGRPESELE